MSQIVSAAGPVPSVITACSSEAQPVSSPRVSSNSPEASRRGDLLRSAKLIGLLTLASRVLGLARDSALSAVFGTGGIASAFSIAFQIPNLFRRLFGEGALSAASIPVLTETLSRQGKTQADLLAGRIMGLLMVILTALCVIGEAVIAILFFRSHTDDAALVLTLSALMLPYMIFICGAALLGGVQNVFDRFASAAAAPILLNLCMIVATLFAQHFTQNLRTGIVILSAAVVASGMVQLAWQWTATRRVGLKIPLSLDTTDPAIRRIGVTMLPMVIGLATIQINTFADSLISWWLVPLEFAPGSHVAEHVGPAFLDRAARLYQFPLGVFASALATAIFPMLSRFASVKDFAGLSRTLSRGIRVASFEGIPCLIGLIMVREPLIRTLFAHGKFNDFPQAVDRVGTALFMFSLGIWAFGINQLIVRAFYAMQDAKTPLWISVRNVALNLILNLILVHTVLREAGLALATSICAMIQVAVLLWKFHHKYVKLEWRQTFVSIAKTLLASLAMGIALYYMDRHLAHLRPAMRLMLLIAVGAAVYLASALALRCEELRDMLKR